MEEKLRTAAKIVVLKRVLAKRQTDHAEEAVHHWRRKLKLKPTSRRQKRRLYEEKKESALFTVISLLWRKKPLLVREKSPVGYRLWKGGGGEQSASWKSFSLTLRDKLIIRAKEKSRARTNAHVDTLAQLNDM